MVTFENVCWLAQETSSSVCVKIQCLSRLSPLFVFYYPTAPRRVQISRISPKTRTNITRYSRGPVRQVCLLLTNQLAGFLAPIPLRFPYFCHTFPRKIRPYGHKTLACWIINLLLDVLLCSIAENFYSLFVFWLALRARQKMKILHNS